MEARTLIIKIEENRGAHIVSWVKDNIEYSEEVYTFSNVENSFCGHKIWDIDAIFHEIKRGLKFAYSIYPDIAEVRIKTWQYDYVLMCGDMELLPCYSYRDTRIRELDEFGGARTEASTMPQIIVDMNHGRLRAATDILMMPDYFVYRLTGVKNRSNRHNTDFRTLRVRPEIEAELGRECRVAIG